jgi:hypothetical protein
MKTIVIPANKPETKKPRKPITRKVIGTLSDVVIEKIPTLYNDKDGFLYVACNSEKLHLVTERSSFRYFQKRKNIPEKVRFFDTIYELKTLLEEKGFLI